MLDQAECFGAAYCIHDVKAIRLEISSFDVTFHLLIVNIKDSLIVCHDRTPW
jgi:hypothetical protein